MDFDIIIKFITGGLNHDPTTPQLDKVVSSNIVLIVILSIIIIAVTVGKYAIAMKMLGKKKAWKSLIPFYGLMTLFKLVDLNPYFAIAVAIPGLGLIPYAIFCFYIPKAFGQKIDMQLLCVFFPYVILNMLGFDKKYEFQYVKGKNVAFKNEFRTVMPEDLSKDALTPAGAVNGAAVTPMMAKESMISRAASAAAEQTRLIREEQEKAAAEEARKKKEEEEKKKAAKNKSEDYNYDIFENKTESGPEAASLGIEFNIVNGKFKSAKTPAPAPKPVAPVQPAAPAQPVASAPQSALTKQPASAPKPAPAPQSETPVLQVAHPTPEPVSQPVAAQPATPAPQPVAQPAPAPAPAQEPAPGIEITTVPPTVQ
jgi:hypothetical protein